MYKQQVVIIILLIIAGTCTSMRAQRLIGMTQMLDYPLNLDSLRYSKILDYMLSTCSFSELYNEKKRQFARSFCQDEKGRYYGLIYEQENIQVGAYYLYELHNLWFDYERKVKIDSLHLTLMDDLYYDEKTHSIFIFLLDIYRVDIQSFSVEKIEGIPDSADFLLDLVKINGTVYGLKGYPQKDISKGLELHRMREDTVYKSSEYVMSFPFDAEVVGDIFTVRHDCDSLTVYVKNARNIFQINQDFTDYTMVCDEVILKRYADTVSENVRQLITNIFSLEEYKVREPCKDTIDLDFGDKTLGGYDVQYGIGCKEGAYRLSEEEISVYGDRALDSIVISTPHGELEFLNTGTQRMGFRLEKRHAQKLVISSAKSHDLSGYAEVLEEIRYEIVHNQMPSGLSQLTISVLGYSQDIRTDTAFAMIEYEVEDISAGVDEWVTFCPNGEVVDLRDYLSSEASEEGVWEPELSGHKFDPGKNAEGLYYYIVADGKCMYVDTAEFMIEVAEDNSDFLGSDTMLCEGDVYTVDIENKGTVLWGDGSTGDMRMFPISGVYRAELTDENGCKWADSLEVRYEKYTEIEEEVTVCGGGYEYEGEMFTRDTMIEEVLMGVGGACDTIRRIEILFQGIGEVMVRSNLTVCEGSVGYVELGIEGDVSAIRWSDGQEGRYAEFENPGRYSVEIESENCDTTLIFAVKACEGRKIYIPNAISPNGDGINDVLKVYNYDPSGVVHMEIYDKWGGIMYESGTGEWDGKVEQRAVSAGVYLYKVEWKSGDDIVIYRGGVTVIR